MREGREKSEWLQFCGCALAMAAVIVVLFFLTLPSLEAFTQWEDDAGWIRDSALSALSWDAVRTAFTCAIEGQYIPTVWLSFLFDRMLFGVGAFWYHLHSLMGHITSSIVLMACYRLLGMRMRLAFVCALIWAVLPPQLANAAGIATRTTIARNLFSFIALTLFVAAYNKPRRWRWDCVCACVGFLAAGASVQCMLLPIMMFAAVLWQCNGTVKTRVTAALKHGALAIFLVLLTYPYALYVTTLNAPTGINCALFHSFILCAIGLALTRMTRKKTL